MNWLKVHNGDAPLIISIPHAGIIIPHEIDGYTDPQMVIKDADYHVEKLYDFARELGATIIQTEISRAVIDVNRNPDGMSLYPGQSTTELCPTSNFDGSALYSASKEPDDIEIIRRREKYFAPYHAQISKEISRLRAQYSNIVLYDAHSIKSIVPRFFDGQLPIYNIGTNDGQSCAKELENLVLGQCPAGESVINGRFKGGYITRHYGQPENGVHAIQMELAMRAYLESEDFEHSPDWNLDFAKNCQEILRNILTKTIEFAEGENAKTR
jgi:N-formylglutamate deformylase